MDIALYLKYWGSTLYSFWNEPEKSLLTGDIFVIKLSKM